MGESIFLVKIQICSPYIITENKPLESSFQKLMVELQTFSLICPWKSVFISVYKTGVLVYTTSDSIFLVFSIREIVGT